MQCDHVTYFTLDSITWLVCEFRQLWFNCLLFCAIFCFCWLLVICRTQFCIIINRKTLFVYCGPLSPRYAVWPEAFPRTSVRFYIWSLSTVRALICQYKQTYFGSERDKSCTEMRPAVLCTSVPVQHRYIRSAPVPLVQIDYWGVLCVFQYFHHAFRESNNSINNRVYIFDNFGWKYQNRQKVLNHFMLVIVLGHVHMFLHIKVVSHSVSDMFDKHTYRLPS